MRRPVRCRSLALVALAACAHAPHAAPKEDVAKIEAEMPRLMALASIPGVELAVVRDEAYALRSFGVESAETRAPITAATTFEAASLTKPLFAYAVMKLVDQGKLGLDIPLIQYLPTYDAAPDPRLAKITARHALSHTTGFPNWRSGALAIQREPGAQFSYSGEGIVYLARVVEKVTGEPFAAFMQHTVLDPLEMTHSGFGPASAAQHDAWGNVVAGVPAEMMKSRAPAAGLHTTAEDYAKFVIAVWNGTGLSAATRERMLSPQAQVIDGGPNSLDRVAPSSRKDLAWGLGWGLERIDGGAAFWHWGDNGGAQAFVMARESPRVAVVMFANSSNGLSIVRDVLAATIGGEHPALAWAGYEQYDEPRATLARDIHARGAAAALEAYRASKAPRATEQALNSLAYQLARAKQLGDAIAVAAQNAADHPQSANAFDSLGEIHDLAGDRAHAIESYARSVELDPRNAHGVSELARLRGAK